MHPDSEVVQMRNISQFSNMDHKFKVLEKLRKPINYVTSYQIYMQALVQSKTCCVCRKTIGMSIPCDIKQEGTLYLVFYAEANRRPWASLNE